MPDPLELLTPSTESRGGARAPGLSDTVYRIGDTKLSKSLNESILIVEEDGLEQELKEEVINLWNEVEEHFKEERKPRR